LDISDRITVTYNAQSYALDAIAKQIEFISNEVLATSMAYDSGLDQGENELGLVVTLMKA